jgi:hypothetical protein
MAIGIKRIVLDVLKPLEGMSMVDLSILLSEMDGVFGVNITLLEIDKQTENIKITMEGDDISYDKVMKELEKHGAVIHSIDEVAAGRRMIDSVETPQD